MINYSIIIPHKNIPHLLQRCLDSIPHREDIQIIIIDDNSDENKVNFAHFPGLREKNVEIYFAKEGKGAGYARNVGLEHAKGKWLLFADADDFFTQDAFEYLFAEVDSQYEIIYFKATSCFSDTYEPTEKVKNINQRIDNFIQKIDNAEDLIRYRSFVPWGKMIKRELVIRENIQFDEVTASNDVMFSALTGHYALGVNAIDHPIYCYTISRGSLTNTLNFENLNSIYFIALRYNQFLRKQDKKQYQRSIIYYLFSSLKYGTGTFCKFVKLAIEYKCNPFINMGHWLGGYLSLYQERMKNKKYIIKNN